MAPLPESVTLEAFPEVSKTIGFLGSFLSFFIIYGLHVKMNSAAVVSNHDGVGLLCTKFEFACLIILLLISCETSFERPRLSPQPQWLTSDNASGTIKLLLTCGKNGNLNGT